MTATSTTVLASCANNTEFRAMGQAHADACDLVGFPRSTDTGQIDWSTVTLPGTTSTFIGYEIRYLDDSLHASKPCYVKFEWYTGTALAAKFILYVTIGSGSDGAGTITGVMFSRANATGGTGNLVVATTPSFYCANAGYVAMILHRGAIAGSCLGAVLVCRTTDASGTPTATGFYLFVSSSTSLTRTTFISSAVADSTYWASLPTGGTTMLVGGEATVVRVYGLQPEYLCIPQVLLYMDSDLSSEAAFAETPVGATSRSYLTLGGTEGTLPTAQPGVRLAMQYD